MSSLTLVLLAGLGSLVGTHFATARLGIVVAADARRRTQPPVGPTAAMMVSAGPQGGPTRPPDRPARVPFAPNDPLARYRAVTGSQARVRWWQKVVSLVSLAALVVVLGALLAAVMGLIVISARILLDVLVS